MNRVWDVDEPGTRATDPETSREAAASVTNVQALRALILEILADFDMTDERLVEIVKERGFMASDSGVRTRRSELVTRGEVEDSGFRGKTRSGRATIIWRKA